MVDRDKYEAIMADFVAQMAEAANIFDKEMRVHAEKLGELMTKQSDAHLVSSSTPADNQQESATPTSGGGATRLFD